MKKPIIFLFLFLILLASPFSVFALKIDSQEGKVETPQCCKLKHKIEGWGASYKAGDWVGAPSSTNVSLCVYCPGASDCEADPNWAGFCMVDGIASVGDIVAWVAMIAVGVGLLFAGVMFITAAGSPERIKKAKAIFYWSLVGVLVAVLAKFIPGVIRYFVGI